MSPEQLSGEPVDATADQFAFCASLWEALHGEPPFEGVDLHVLLGNLRGGRLRAPSRRDVPRAVHEALARGLAADRSARYPSMTALLRDLERDSRAAWRRRLGAVAAVSVLALAVGAARLAGSRQPPLCPSASPLLLGAWDDARRAQLEASFRATQAPFAEDAVRGTERALDDYASRWVAMHQQTCEATRVRAEQSAELMDLRMACLVDRLQGLRALVDQLVRADASAVEAALRAADSLGPLSRCADTASLRAPLPLPADPAKRRDIESVRAQLAHARALEQTVHVPEALTVVADAVAAAHSTAYAPVEAEALETQGALLASAGEDKRAASTLEDAILSAVAGRDESTEAQAWVDSVSVAADDGRLGEGSDLARHAHAALARDPDDGRLAALLTSEAVIADTDEKLDVAQAKLEQALALEERSLAADHPAVAVTLNRLAYTLFHEARYDESLALYRRALSIREAAFGPSHPLVGEVDQGIGNALSGKGDYVSAIATYRRVLDLYTAAYGPENRKVAACLSALGLAFAYSHGFREGIDAEKQAVAIDERVLPPDHPDTANSLINETEAYAWAGRWDETRSRPRRERSR